MLRTKSSAEVRELPTTTISLVFRRVSAKCLARDNRSAPDADWKTRSMGIAIVEENEQSFKNFVLNARDRRYGNWVMLEDRIKELKADPRFRDTLQNPAMIARSESSLRDNFEQIASGSALVE
jgi:hypothetical protein